MPGPYGILFNLACCFMTDPFCLILGFGQKPRHLFQVVDQLVYIPQCGMILPIGCTVTAVSHGHNTFPQSDCGFLLRTQFRHMIPQQSCIYEGTICVIMLSHRME